MMLNNRTLLSEWVPSTLIVFWWLKENLYSQNSWFCVSITELINAALCWIVCSGSVEFLNSDLEVFENDTSFEVCVRAQGYGFAVNITTGPGMFLVGREGLSLFCPAFCMCTTKFFLWRRVISALQGKPRCKYGAHQCRCIFLVTMEFCIKDT